MCIIPCHILNLFIIHWLLTKMGIMYVEAESLRSGNNETLDKLEEGVIIVEESTQDILYCNAAAADPLKGKLSQGSSFKMDMDAKPGLKSLVQ
mmetsp:Transcript_7256/g.8697  ORF Transcript_7256/g.8697 Transcript_7256/m.8697 type:complete len:93 (-) Transcript_7256:217-495(-)